MSTKNQSKDSKGIVPKESNNAGTEAKDKPSISVSEKEQLFSKTDLSKPFECAKIYWTISNLSHNPKSKYSLRSSTFYLNASERTSWYLGFTWQSNHAHHDQSLVIHLIRRSADPVKKIRLSLRLLYKNEDGIYAGGVAKHAYSAEKGIVCSSEYQMRNYCFYIFEIECQMIIYKESEPQPFEYSLASALALKIPKDEVLGDRCIPALIISLENNEIKIDRNIWNQFPELEAIMRLSMTNSIVLPANGITTVQLLAYLHLKRLDYQVETWITFELEELAKNLDLEDLINLLVPTEIYIVSDAGGGYCRYIWEIEKFSLNKTNELLENGFVSNCGKIKWRIQLLETPSEIRCGVRITKNSPEFQLNIRISPYITEETEVNIIDSSFFSVAEGASELRNLIIKDPAGEYKNTYLTGDAISILCQVLYSDLKFKNKIDTVVSRNIILNDSDLEEPMANPTIEDDSDLVVTTGDRSFRVHKEILESRSQGFANLLKGKNKSEILLPEIPSDLMELILQFIYSGKLNTKDWATVYRLYRQVHSFPVFLLIEICEEFFMFNLKPNNWQDLLNWIFRTENRNFLQNILQAIECNELISNTKKWETVSQSRSFNTKVAALLNKSH